MPDAGDDVVRRKTILWISFPAVALVAFAAGTFGVLRLRSATPVLDRAGIQVDTVQRGPMTVRVQGLGVLVPEETRWLAAATDAHVDEIFLHAGAHVRKDSVLMQLSNPDLDRQVVDAELATKKAEAELANLRVQLQEQLLNERATEAQLEAEATQAKLEAERDESLLHLQIGSAMNAKISRARAESLATRLQIEKERLAIAEEARQAQLAAKQAEVAQVQALYALKQQQKDALNVRAGIAGVLEEVSVDPGQQVARGTNLARVTGSARLMARLHVPESRAKDLQLGQRASIEVQDRAYPGHVSRIDPGVQNGSVNVDVKFDEAQPAGARSDLTVSGTVDIERVPSAVILKRPLQVHPDERISLYRVAPGGAEAERVDVQIGRVSTDSVEIRSGLEPGDNVIVSDMSAWNKYGTLRLK
jgi:HlyD family secretion protein